MKALTLRPGVPDSVAVTDLSEPPGPADGVLVETLAVGICGTDLEMVAGEFGVAAPGRDRLVLGHESLGRVLAAPEGSGLAPGDLVVGIVRRPCAPPCAPCARGEWDLCLTGTYAERGITALDGFGAERFRIEPAFAVRVDPALGGLGVLLEPASVLAKVWERLDRLAGTGPTGPPRTVVVTGAGTIGLLAALLARQRGHEVHVVDRATDGPKPGLVRDLGAAYHSGLPPGLAADLAVECTGVPEVVVGLLGLLARGGTACLVGVAPPGRRLEVDMSRLTRDLVLGNQLMLGSVNANRHHCERAAAALAAADQDWLGRLITRRVPLARWEEALERRPDDVKVVLDLTPPTGEPSVRPPDVGSTGDRR